MNWPVVISNGVKFAIIRSSNGLYKNTTSSDGNSRDKMLLKNASELTTAGIPWAIYHYVQPTHDTEQQIALVVSILDELKSLGTSPRTAQFSDGKFLPRVFLDVEELAITNAQIKFFVDGLADQGIGCGVYTRKNIWEPITNGVEVWWQSLMLWLAAYGANDGKIPNFVPDLPRGWTRAHIWQYTSLGGFEVGHTKDSLDVNIACLHLYPIKQPVPPPSAKIDMLQYIRGQHGFQYEMRRPDGAQERYQIQWDAADPKVWYIVKGENQGYYEKWSFDDNFIYLEMDTSPAPASDGTQRYYTIKKNGVRSAKYRRFMSVGEIYNDGGHVVQFYNKTNCQPHPENSGGASNNTVFAKGPYVDAFYNNISLPDVIKCQENTETQYWAKGIGRVRWESAWGMAQVGEIHGIGARPDVKREFIPCAS